MRDALGDSADQRVDLFDGVRTAERKSQARSRLILGEADRHENVRWFGRAARTRGSARNREAFQIERDQQRVAVDSIESQVSGVRRSRRARAVDVRVRNPIENTLLQMIAE